MDNLSNFLSKEIWGNTILSYVIALFVLFLTNILHRYVIRFVKKKFLAPYLTSEKTLAQTLHALKRPSLFIFYAISLKIIFSFWLNFPEKIKPIAKDCGHIFITIAATYFLFKCIDLLFIFLEKKAQKTKSKLDDQILPLGKKASKFFILFLAGLLIFNNLGYNITSILAGLGIGGLAVALAAQETLKNFFGSITICVDHPFEVGERIQIEGQDGTVEAVGFRSTKIRTLDETIVTIPNSKIVESVINNIGQRTKIKNTFNIGLTYNTSYEKTKQALDIIRSILKDHPSTENYLVYFKEFGDFSLNILVVYWCKHIDYESFLQATQEINLEIKKQFEQANIEFAFPTQTVFLENAYPKN